MKMEIEKMMKLAVALSREGMQGKKGGPFGAVVVKGGKVVSEGSNQVTSTNDPTAHAEVVAIRNACKTLGTFSLEGCQIYCSCEPCPMCLSAIYWARIDKIYFANTKHDAASIGFDDAFIYKEFEKKPENRSIPSSKIEEPEAKKVFDDWHADNEKTRY
ncbi:MAG TPA: nucleoside deaminase [Chitinophagales bacterium]|nr:nucleoside deaminase [Chitinophagales bacterium]